MRECTGRVSTSEAIDLGLKRHALVLGQLAETSDVELLHDALHRSRPVGSLSRAACFSLHPLKTAGACGDAGMITTDDEALAERLRQLRNHGFTHRQEDCSTWGYNARMDTLQAALALVKLKYVDEWIRRRRANADVYRARLPDAVRIPSDRPDDFIVYHTFPVQVDRRDELIEHLQANRIGCAVHYRLPIHLLPVARDLGYRAGNFPAAERQADRIVSLPIHQGLTEEHIHHVCDMIEAFYG
ncbi:MAG: DegT/DnrJ/EryC1/StrS family aminotransferase [Planctomycetes bacterium]|nr:DegT/DnrJ/EryC1/StrS family aminotransferase [Planctomycetota bacterium]